MLNTYGIFSVNPATFNNKHGTTYTYPKEARDVVVTLLRIHNLCLNILGYIPGISLISGAVRMLTGTSMVVVTLAVGERNADQGTIIRHWYDEAIQTGIAQIARGALEAFAPFGRFLNLCLDVVGTFVNLEKITSLMGQFSLNAHAPNQPYKDPSYQFPLSILMIV